MKTRIMTAAMVLALTLAVGTASAAALFESAPVAIDAVSSATPKPSAGGSATQTQKTFTAQELAAYNGKNGKKAYIAVNGTVYDVTTLFVNGSHHGAQAGQDLTAIFEKQHSAKKLAGFPVVGVTG